MTPSAASPWPTQALDEIAAITAGQSAPQAAIYFGGANRFVRVSHLDAGSDRVVGFDSVSDAAVRDLGLKLHPAGTIVFPKSGASVRLEKRALLPFDAYLVSHLAAVRGDPRIIDQDFLFYAVRLHRFSDGKADGYPTLKLSEISATQVPVPPLPEQRAIAHVLRTVQQAREATEQVIAAAKELKRSLMRHLFTYGPASSTEVAGRTLRDTDFGSMPSSWEISELDELATVQTGIAKGGKAGAGTRVSVPYLRVANVQDGYLDLSEIKNIEIHEDRVERYLLRAGDVLLTEGGDLDKLGRGTIWTAPISPCVHQNHIFAVRPDRDRMSAEYLSYLVQSPYAKRYFLQVGHRTTNLASINSTKLKAFPVPVPPVHEQRESVRCLTTADRKLLVEEQRRDALDALFSSLLSELMLGRVRVPESLLAEVA